MSRAKFSLHEHDEHHRKTSKPVPSGTSNAFNPPLSKHVSVLPEIRSPSAALATNDETDLVLPTKVFKAKKTSVNDLSQAACSYLWFRRIKEIFLVMGKQNDAFTRLDMEIARADMIKTCEQYLESERPRLGGSHLVRLRRSASLQPMSSLSFAGESRAKESRARESRAKESRARESRAKESRAREVRPMEKQASVCRNVSHVLLS